MPVQVIPKRDAVSSVLIPKWTHFLPPETCSSVTVSSSLLANWDMGVGPKLKHDLLFRQAVTALDTGDLTYLDMLLHTHPWLIRYRQRIGTWYDSGYFAGATVLHHVAGNPIRCPLPANIMDITRLLLQHGADPNVVTLGGATTCELLLTSMQASGASVAVPLCDMLIAAGAHDELSDPDVLTLPLRNAAPTTAAALVRRGAVMDLRHAAGLGAQDRLQALLAASVDPELCDEALFFACVRRQQESALLLLQHGARGDRLYLRVARMLVPPCMRPPGEDIWNWSNFCWIAPWMPPWSIPSSEGQR